MERSELSMAVSTERSLGKGSAYGVGMGGRDRANFGFYNIGVRSGDHEDSQMQKCWNTSFFFLKTVYLFDREIERT